MSDIPENQIEGWLKKLERESWQLELLVSAFTIFLLIGANAQFDEFLTRLSFSYNVSKPPASYGFMFLILISQSIYILTICLVIHLLLRGFWIGTIGLRSVQSTIDFEKLNYSDFFVEKLKKKIISLDRMVIILDEICSVIFAFSFLLISILVAFGLFLIYNALIVLAISTIVDWLPDVVSKIFGVSFGIVFIVTTLFGLFYMIDYFTLGFFKKIKWFSKFYYPFYRLYSFITLSFLSRSIYYYLISKFSKKRIRIVYALVGLTVVFMTLFSFDQHQYFPNDSKAKVITTDFYDDQRPDDQYIKRVSIESRFIDRNLFQVFLRYNPADNSIIQSQCEDFVPLIDDGINFNYVFAAEKGNLLITGVDFTNENSEQLLQCQKSIYQIQINDSIYTDLKYHFYIHPSKKQKGLLTTIPTDAFKEGENELRVEKIENDSTSIFGDFVTIPFWYSSN